MSHTRRLLLCTALLASFAAGAAQAQTAAPPPTRLRGTIASLDGAVLSVVTREGPTVTVTLPDGMQPTALKRLTLDAITKDTFVATVAAPDAEGVLTSIYVAILPDSLRATNQLHSNWDLAPGTSMTNAIVGSMVEAKNGRKLTMTYNGTPIEIVVPPDVPVISNIPATREDLKPGAKVFIVAAKTGEGAYTATRITVGKDGVNPPQ